MHGRVEVAYVVHVQVRALDGMSSGVFRRGRTRGSLPEGERGVKEFDLETLGVRLRSSYRCPVLE